jgi:protein involved in polysaccharide export with SLBB domain
MENLVVLVELPPASSPQGVLMAENLPHVIWLSDTEKSDAAESAAQVKTLRETACNLVGAVLNRAPEPLIKNRFVRWFGYSSYLWIAASFPLQAQETATTSHLPDAPRAEVSGEHIAALSHARAPWQERLTLGPGDVLNLHLYGEPELTRSEVAVSPDGTITYLEALDVPAAGLTVDELRARLDSELSKYRREPRTIVVPVSYQSKKYFMLGGVAEKGAFTLERPITLLEAISRSRGLETANVDGNIVEMHDFSRSFLSRNGRRVPVDFERLFLRGDLTQNVQLAPGDYVYVAPGDLKEVYVLGEVGAPGIVSYTHGLSAIGAIAGRGGFTTRAWQKRVLVVRGSMQNPETFILNTSEVLSARGAGFEMQARDIIFVSSRPWAKAEDLLDIAITAFLEAAVITWTGQTITPIIR